MEITSSLINDPSMSVVKKSLLELDQYDDDLEFRIDTLEYINDVSYDEDDQFFFDCLPTVLFVNTHTAPEYADSIAFTTPDKAIFLNCPGDKPGKSMPKWEFIYDHECLHQLWDTFGVADDIKKAGVKYDHNLLNIASDCVINDYLKNIRKKEWIGFGIDPDYIREKYGVNYDRKNDTQYGLYVKLLAKLDEIKDDPFYKDDTQFPGTIDVPINQGGGDGPTPPPPPQEKHSDDFKRGWRDGISDVLDKKVDPTTYKPKSDKDDYTQGYNAVIENIKQGLEQGITLSQDGGGNNQGPQSDLADIPWNIPPQNSNGQSDDSKDSDNQDNQQGGSGSSDKDIDKMSGDEAAKDAQTSADAAKQAAQQAQDKADKTGDKADQAAANKAQQAAQDSQDAADKAKDAATNGDEEGAQDAAKEARDKAAEAQQAAGKDDSYSGKAQAAAQRAEQAAKKAEAAANSAKGDKDYKDKKTATEKAKDAAKEAKQAADAATKADAKGNEKAAKKAAADAENAAQEAEANARDAGADVEVHQEGDNANANQNPGKKQPSNDKGKGNQHNPITSITKVDMDQIRKAADEAYKNAISKISGEFGKLIKKIKMSKQLKTSLVTNITSGAKGWNDKMKSIILGYVKAQLNKFKRQKQATWKRVKRGSGFIQPGQIMQKGKIQKKNGLPINLAFYIDRSGSMDQGNALEHAFKAAYMISERVKKLFKSDKMVSDTTFKFTSFDTQFHDVKMGDIPNSGGCTAPFEQIFDYIVEQTNDYMINIIITDGQMDANESAIMKRIKELNGLVLYIANQNCKEIESIAKKIPEKVKFVLADSSFTLA